MDMQDVTVKVPTDRLADFYAMYGGWLAGTDVQPEQEPVPVSRWQDTDEDLALAKVVWTKFSHRAQDMFGSMIDNPGEKYTGEQLAEAHDIPNGKYGVAGVLAWPGRHCAAVNRTLPTEWDSDSGKYWMKPEIAALFTKARDAA
jgi:hypothetical protein